MDGQRIIEVNGVDLCIDTTGDPADPAILLIGGALAQQVALAHPERVDSLVLLSTSPAVPVRSALPPMSEELRDWFAAQVPWPDWAERAAVIDYLTGYERQLEAAEYFDEAHAGVGHQVPPRAWWTPVITAMLRHDSD